MNEEEKKAIKYLNGIIEINNIKIKNIEEKGDVSLTGFGTMHDVYKLQNLNYILVLNLIEKQDKMIDYMAEYLADMDFDECCAEIPEPCFGCSWEDYEPHTNCIKEYFRKRVEKDG